MKTLLIKTRSIQTFFVLRMSVCRRRGWWLSIKADTARSVHQADSIVLPGKDELRCTGKPAQSSALLLLAAASAVAEYADGADTQRHHHVAVKLDERGRFPLHAEVSLAIM